MGKLTHVDDKGKATMVNVSDKSVSSRVAKASGHITLATSTVELINSNSLRKGDVLTVAQIAGINAAKLTSGLIPLCHNIVIDSVKVEATTDKTGVFVSSEVICTGRTGVEMEALTAVSVALLTVYDMCKAADKNMVIDNIQLDHKEKHEIT
jgi:cyclic pyranopterin phosphate synthase